MCEFATSGFASGTAAAAMLFVPTLLSVAGIALWAAFGRHPWRHLSPLAGVATSAPTDHNGPDAPIAILRERFVRGEIDLATFEERVAHLLQADREAQG